MAQLPPLVVPVTAKAKGMWKLALAAFLGKLAARHGVKVDICVELHEPRSK